ncbi:Hypothetical_protein [Hexamita inflata]|nr:Hypothetical protein HINF_LOCUS29430 [Hexamita inflata]CAI9975217.1 Hypothetical protein HINF_LOCUS62862 [Hexamita inflata]
MFTENINVTMSWISLLYQSIVLNSSLIRFENQIWSTEILTSLPFYRQPETHNSENSDDTSIRSLISNYTLIQFSVFTRRSSVRRRKGRLVLSECCFGLQYSNSLLYKLTCCQLRIHYMPHVRSDYQKRGETQVGNLTNSEQFKYVSTLLLACACVQLKLRIFVFYTCLWKAIGV